MGLLDTVIARIVASIINTKMPLPRFLLFPSESFIEKSPKRTQAFLLSCNADALELFAKRKVPLIVNEAIKRTPALKDFYLKNGIGTAEIKNFDDFQRLPETNKENYTKAYLLKKRCIDCEPPSTGNIYESAGTSGKPTIWLQSLNEINVFKYFVCFAMDYTYKVYSRKYVLLNCWAFGTWPTAIDFSFSSEEFSEVVNIGTDIDRVIEIIKSLGADKEYIITGYPPFLRNLIDEGRGKGIDWKKYKIDIITGGEGFVEEWRDNLLQDLRKGAIIRSAYGTSDKGLGEGFETDLTVTIRRIARIMMAYIHNGKEEAREISKKYFDGIILPKNKETAINFLNELFKVDPLKDSRLPMLFQYDPTTYFEEEAVNKTADGNEIKEWVTTVLKQEMAIPRVRFNVKDEGGIISMKDMKKVIEKNLMKFEQFTDVTGIDRKRILPLPFFFIFGRSDGTISVDGSKIYPEEVWEMVESIGKLRSAINSFVMFITHDHRLGVSFELKKGIKIVNEKYYKNIIKNSLAKYSIGLKALVQEKLKSSDLEVLFCEFGCGQFSESPSTKRRVKYVYVAQKVKKNIKK